MFPNLTHSHQTKQPFTKHRESRSANPSPLRSHSPLDIPLDVPLSYRQRRPQETDHLPLTDGWLFRGVRTRVGDLALADIVAVAGTIAARRLGCPEVLCEYTWVETNGAGGGAAWPAVYVPGNAPVWRGMLRGGDLKQARRALSVRDEHTQRQPLFPYEPTFRALEEAQAHAQARHSETAGKHIREPIHFGAVEVVSDADTLAHLFAFISSSYPSKTAPFRLELSMVRNTLFISKAEHPRRGNTAKRGRVPTTMPDWVTDAVLSLGTRGAHVPFSGGHWRLIRYRLGTMVCVVRAKVDFVYENRQTVGEIIVDPLKGMKPEIVKGDEESDIDIWKTTVKSVGGGTQAGAPGLVIVRYQSEDAKEKLVRNMPAIWFGRVSSVIDAVVSPKLEVMDISLLSVRAKYVRWEKQHQASLKRMAGLLKRLKCVTRALGGSCITVADPSQRCFTILKPVIKRTPVPEDVAVRFWGEDDDPDETEYESTAASMVSELSNLSRTPSGFEDWTLESPMGESNKKRPNSDIHHGPSKRPKSNPIGLVRGWLNHGMDDPDCGPAGRDGENENEDPTQIESHGSISRRGFALRDEHSGSKLGYDGTIEHDDSIETEDGESEEVEDQFEDDEDSDQESGSVWAEDGG